MRIYADMNEERCGRIDMNSKFGIIVLVLADILRSTVDDQHC